MRVLLLALALGGCVAYVPDQSPPVAEIGQPDTYRFKIAVNTVTPEDFAWEKLQPDVEAYQRQNGFKSYTVTNRFRAVGYYEYSVRFVR